jgi:hypothetical protein
VDSAQQVAVVLAVILVAGFLWSGRHDRRRRLGRAFDRQARTEAALIRAARRDRAQRQLRASARNPAPLERRQGPNEWVRPPAGARSSARSRG